MLINGHNLYVEQFGPETGPEVVLLHHGLGSVKAWRGQIPALVEHGYHVTAYDRWGYGGSDERSGLDLPTFAADVNDLHGLLNSSGIKRATLVGHSDGGTIALYFAAQYPELVSCLVIVAAHIYIERKMEAGILGISQSFKTDGRFRKSLLSIHGAKYESVFHNWFDGWHRMDNIPWDMRPTIRQINCPALIIQGTEDEHATAQHAKDIAKEIPGADICIIQGAGHMLPQENFELFNPILLQFLKSNALEPSMLSR